MHAGDCDMRAGAYSLRMETGVLPVMSMSKEGQPGCSARFCPFGPSSGSSRDGSVAGRRRGPEGTTAAAAEVELGR